MQEVGMYACRNCGHTITLPPDRKEIKRACRVCLTGEMVPVAINFEKHIFEVPAK